MNVNRRMVVAALAAAVVAPLVLAAQDLHPSRRPSPLGMARTMLGDAYVRVVYGRPYRARSQEHLRHQGERRGGDLRRAMAHRGQRSNGVDRVTRDVLVGGQKLPAGTYSLSTTPAPGTWKVHINSKLGLDGLGIFANNTFTPVDLAPTDVLTVSATATELPEDKEVDQLTFDFEKTPAGADMVLRWIRTGGAGSESRWRSS